MTEPSKTPRTDALIASVGEAYRSGGELTNVHLRATALKGLAETLERELATASLAISEGKSAHEESERQLREWQDRYQGEYDIVARVWKALGVDSYEGASGKTIDQLVRERVTYAEELLRALKMSVALQQTTNPDCDEVDEIMDKLCEVIRGADPEAFDVNGVLRRDRCPPREWLRLKTENEIRTEGCAHEWVSADNPVVTGAVMCKKCHRIEAATAPGSIEPKYPTPTCHAIGPTLDHDKAWEAFCEWRSKRPAGWHLANQEQKQHDAFMAGARWFQTFPSQSTVKP